MTGDKAKKKYNKGETSGIKYIVVKTEYPADLELEQNVMDFGPDPEQDSDDITPDEKLVPEQVPHEAKPESKEKY
jgi:hypothetical protein